MSDRESKRIKRNGTSIMRYAIQPGMNSGQTLLLLNEEDLGVIIEKHLKAFFDKYMINERKSEEVDAFLTEAEVQKQLNVGHATLWRWHAKGYLRHVKIGRRCLWKQSDIYELLNR